MANQDLEKNLHSVKPTAIKESSSFGDTHFTACENLHRTPRVHRSTDFTLRVFQIATEGPTGKGLVNDFTPFMKLAA